jgi:hypothetical protein
VNQVIESLLQIAGEDPLPGAHTSSHWQRYGKGIKIERRGEKLVLSASGFTAQSRANLLGKLLYSAERLSYAKVTSRLKSHRFVWNEAKRLARDLRVDLPRHEWTSATALAVLLDHFGEYNLAPKTVALIGDGDGFLGALILRCLSGTNIRIYTIDLPTVLAFQAHTHETANPWVTMSLLSATDIDRQIIFVHPKDIELIRDRIDCAISFVSMQEMNAFSIASYFTFLRRRSGPRSRFYCVGRLRKEMPGSEIASFFDYPWRADDKVFIDEPPPYLTHFFDQHMYPNGPRLFGVRIPFVNYWDGRAWHRLAHLAPLP